MLGVSAWLWAQDADKSVAAAAIDEVRALGEDLAWGYREVAAITDDPEERRRLVDEFERLNRDTIELERALGAEVAKLLSGPEKTPGPAAEISATASPEEHLLHDIRLTLAAGMRTAMAAADPERRREMVDAELEATAALRSEEVRLAAAIAAAASEGDESNESPAEDSGAGPDGALTAEEDELITLRKTIRDRYSKALKTDDPEQRREMVDRLEEDLAAVIAREHVLRQLVRRQRAESAALEQQPQP